MIGKIILTLCFVVALASTAWIFLSVRNFVKLVDFFIAILT
tara:strand:- start:513 stop:635 length:123 start_codon:yes stop_codon:yes gene_type:complete